MNKIDEMIRELCPVGVKRVKLGEVCERIFAGGTPSTKRDDFYDGDIPWIRSGEIDFNRIYKAERNITVAGLSGSSAKMMKAKSVVMALTGATVAKVATVEIETSANQSVATFECKEQTLHYRFLYYYLEQNYLSIKGSAQGALTSLNLQMVKAIEIPLPPLAIQQEIVSILDSFSSLLSKLEEELAVRQKQMEFYREKLLTFDKDDNSVKWMKLGEVGDVCMCRRILKQQTSTDGEIPFYKIGTFGKLADAYISDELYREYKEKYKFPKKGEILISAAGTIGRTVVYDGEPAYFQDSNIVWISNDEKNVYNTFLSYVYSVAKWDVDNGGVVARLYNSNISRTIIPVPPLSRQQEIISTLDTMSSLIDKLKEEIELRKKQYEYYREALLSF